MSLQYILDAPEPYSQSYCKPTAGLEDSLRTMLIPTRSNTPENEKSNYDNSSDRDSTTDSMPRPKRLLSSSSSMTSVDMSEGNSFEIEYSFLTW